MCVLPSTTNFLIVLTVGIMMIIASWTITNYENIVDKYLWNTHGGQISLLFNFISLFLMHL